MDPRQANTQKALLSVTVFIVSTKLGGGVEICYFSFSALPSKFFLLSPKGQFTAEELIFFES